MSRHLRVQFESTYSAFAFGDLVVRDAIEALTGRRPVFAGVTRAWSCSEKTARQLVAWAEHQGWSVEVMGPRSAVPRPTPVTPAVAAPEPQDSLW